MRPALGYHRQIHEDCGFQTSKEKEQKDLRSCRKIGEKDLETTWYTCRHHL
jgi:hypothetical protein